MLQCDTKILYVYFTLEAIAFTRRKQKEQTMRVEEIQNKLTDTQGKRYVHVYIYIYIIINP